MDIGAHDGISLSNSKAFEELGWIGACIEPNPTVFAKLVNNRQCECYNVALGQPRGQMQFLAIEGYAEMLSGLYQNYDPRHLQRIQNEVNQHGGKINVIDVEVVPFNELIVATHIDYLSIDVEGAELAILKTIDFDKYHIQCITLENNYKEPELDNYLLERGYQIIAQLGCDNVFWKTN